jgi:L-ascorbate metabolism protein UlaG (beta-lactamase superfamily)
VRKVNNIRVLRIFLIFIIIAMTRPGYTQIIPSFDKVNTSAGIVEMHFIGHGSLMFKVNGYVIHLDPFDGAGDYKFLPKADLILVTHEHGDHLDVPLIEKLKKEETLVFCNEKSTAKISWGLVMHDGDIQEINNIVIEAVPAYNVVNKRSDGQPFHPKGDGIGYILTIGNKRFYIAGDTENIEEMKELKDIDVAFLPMNLPYTMTPEMVADAAMAFRPKILYPYHFGETNTDEIVRLLKDSGIIVRIRNLQ